MPCPPHPATREEAYHLPRWALYTTRASPYSVPWPAQNGEGLILVNVAPPSVEYDIPEDLCSFTPAESTYATAIVLPLPHTTPPNCTLKGNGCGPVITSTSVPP